MKNRPQGCSLIAVVAILATVMNGCSARSVTFTNETNLPLQIELAIGFVPYRWFSNDQNFRFRLKKGESWDSRRASQDERVEWPAAEGVRDGFLVRAPKVGTEFVLYVLAGNCEHASINIGGHPPDWHIDAVDRSGNAIGIELSKITKSDL